MSFHLPWELHRLWYGKTSWVAVTGGAQMIDYSPTGDFAGALYLVLYHYYFPNAWRLAWEDIEILNTQHMYITSPKEL